MPFKVRNRINKTTLILLGLFLLFVVAICLTPWANTKTVNRYIQSIDQNPMDYVGKTQANQSLWHETKQQRLESFTQRYFSPWHQGQAVFDKDAIKDELRGAKATLIKSKHKWGSNLQKWPHSLTQTIIANAQIETFPNMNQPGITIHSAEIECWPTNTPMFNDPSKAGENFPFDYMQSAHVEANKPLRILQKSRDGLWYCVQFAGFYGWIRSHDVAFVDQQFINRFEKAPFKVAVKDDQALIHNNSVHGKTRLGMIYPAVEPHSESGANFDIYSAVRQANSYAKLIAVNADTHGLKTFPMPYNPHNVAELAQTKMGAYYGWGSIRGTRDCSATTRDLLAPFGIWLPRNSSWQARLGGQQIDLAGLSNQRKLDTIKEQGRPFQTLINFKGHVALYLGVHQGKPYMLHDMWALKVRNSRGQDDRALVGRTVITPVDFGHGYINATHSLLDKAVSITILKPVQNPASS